MSKRLFYFLSFGATVYGSLVLLRNNISGKEYTSEEHLYGKVAIVTGANTGLGKEVAKNLSKRGARVIMACRDLEKCEKARKEIIDETFNKSIKCVECDLASLESIKNFTNIIKKDEKFVHILVNNAGVSWCPKTYTKEGFEMQLGVNFLGHFYLTNQLLDKLKYSEPSRIVNVTCSAYKIGEINFNDLNSSNNYDTKIAYSQSKLANVLFTYKLTELLKDTNISVFSVDPGASQTDILRHSSYSKSNISAPLISPFFETFLKTAAKGAQNIIYCCVEPGLEKSNGKLIREFKEEEVTKNGINKQVADRLWLIAEKWTRLK